MSFLKSLYIILIFDAQYIYSLKLYLQYLQNAMAKYLSKIATYTKYCSHWIFPIRLSPWGSGTFLHHPLLFLVD